MIGLSAGALFSEDFGKDGGRRWRESVRERRMLQADEEDVEG